MNPEARKQLIHERLLQAFSPEKLAVIDDSHKHIGHPGSRDGAGHYTVIIAAAALQNLSRVAAHQKVYAVLNDLIPHEIHALQIKLSK